MNSIDEITLQYLLNPNIFHKIITNKEDNTDNLEKHIRYKKKILNLTEDMFNNKFLNQQIKNEFNCYCKNIIYHIDNENMKKIIQEEYKDFKPKIKKNKLLLDISNNNMDFSLNLTNIVSKNKKQNDLNNFIIKNDNNKKKILPQKKNINI